MAGNRKWSADELKILKDEYGISSFKELSRKLGRSDYAIRKKASNEGISFPQFEKIRDLYFLLLDIKKDVAEIKKVILLNQK